MNVVLPTLSRGWFASPAKRIAFVALLAVAVAGALFTRIERFELRRTEALSFALQDAEVFYLPPVPVLRVMALGHPGFASDLLFIRCVSYFVTHLFSDRTFPWLETYLDRVTRLDPYTEPVYEWAMKAVKYRQMITNDVIAESNRWAERGLQVFPDNWKLYLEIGFNHYFEWTSDTEEQHAEEQRKAVDYFMIAASLPGSRLDPNFVTNLYLKHNEKDMALFYAVQRYQDGSDAEKALLLDRVAALISDQAAHAIAEREAQWKATFPYAPASLYDLVGEWEAPRVPLRLERDTAVEQLDRPFDILDRKPDAADRPTEGSYHRG